MTTCFQLGSEDKPADPELETWWHDAFDSALKKISKKKKRKRSRGDDEEPSKPPTFDELFAATGGARLGMRARADQSGKLQRTSDLNGKSNVGAISEADISSALVAPSELKNVKRDNETPLLSDKNGKAAKKSKKAKEKKKKTKKSKT